MRLLNIIFLSLIICSFSCKKKNLGDCFKSTGDLVEQEREMSTFSKIIINNNVNVLLDPSLSNKIIVSAGENLLDKITTEYNADTLVISNNNSCNWVRDFSVPITVSLPLSQLNNIEYRSIGDINCADTIYCDTLTVNVFEGAGNLNILVNAYQIHSSLHYGTADILISGRCSISYIYSASFGLIDNRNLYCSLVYANNKSSNDLYLRAEKTLAATIESIGNIYYVGSPESISLNQIGSGSLIELSE